MSHVDILHGTIRYYPTDILGQGSYSTVFKGMRMHDAAAVAVKCIDRSRCKHEMIRLLQSEISILQGLRHPNIISLLDSQISENHVYMVLEQCSFGTLDDMIKTNHASMSLPVIRSVISQLTEALVHLHTNAIIHRDVKPANILVHTDRPIWTKLADFGFARRMNQEMTATYCGSPLYMAPEVLTGASYTIMTDIWSAGVVAYQCLTGELPYHATSVHQLREIHRSTSAQVAYPSTADPDLIDFIQLLLRPDPTTRMDSRSMLQHRFLTTGSGKSGNVAPAPAPRTDDPMLSYVVVDKDHVLVHEMADKVTPDTTASSSTMRDRLALLEAMCDVMHYYQDNPLREMIVAAHMLRLLKNTVAMAGHGASRSELGRFRTLFDECVDRISVLRVNVQKGHHDAADNLASADDLLYHFAQLQSHQAKMSSGHDVECGVQCYRKCVVILEYLKTRTTAPGDEAYLAQSIQQTRHELHMLSASGTDHVRYCGRCGTMFATDHKFCSNCGACRAKYIITP